LSDILSIKYIFSLILFNFNREYEHYSSLFMWYSAIITGHIKCNRIYLF